MNKQEKDLNLIKSDTPPKTINFGLFVKINFISSFNKFRNEKDKLINETQKDLIGD